MYWKVLYCLSVFLLPSLGGACRQHNELDDLMRENPFKTDSPASAPAEEVVIISCDYYPLKLPAGVDVKSFASWPALSEKAGSESGLGFSAEQQKLWRENGFEIAVAPLEQWAPLRDEIVKAGGLCLTQTTSFFHSINDIADYPTFWNGQARPLFVAQSDGSLQGYTLPAGDCLFAVQCSPWENKIHSNTIQVSITPVFQGEDRKEKYVKDEMGQFKLISESSRISFPGLQLSSALPRGYFICLAAAASEKSVSNPGDFFLRGHDENTRVFQFVVILVPAIQTAREYKASIQSNPDTNRE